jgi:ubiquinone/menaquinone biosynthesis C-methylase UbiE
MVDDNLFDVVCRRMTSPDTVEMVKRALSRGVVLDTWMNGEEKEQISKQAQIVLKAATERWTSESLHTGAILPNYPMPEEYVYSVFHEILYSMALYIAQKKKGRREVDLVEADEAIDRLSGFIDSEPEGLTAVGILFIAVSAYEDLNAIAYYGRMNREDFLFGHVHRPWSNMVLNPSLALYERIGLVGTVYTDKGALLSLTQRGREVLEMKRHLLSEAGELKWRTENQRWVIFSETDYDKVFSKVFPDFNSSTREYIDCLGLQSGMRVLEVGAGTGRVTIDLGLCDLVGPDGSVVALDPAAAALEKLSAKCRQRDIKNVEVVRGMAEKLPFPDNSFDAAIAVLALHFTDAPQAVAEMVRVTRPGGFVSALSPPPELDLRDIPMVASWFQQLTVMAERFGVPFSEHNGLPVGLTKKIFEQNLKEVKLWGVPATCSAEDHKSFMAFMVKGAAIYQSIFARLPFQERWNIMQQLEADGAKLAKETPREKQRYVDFNEAAWGRVPFRSPNPPHTP